MSSHASARVRWGLAAGLAALTLGSCDWNDPDEVQNSSNFAVVRAQFFASPGSRTPVPGVRLIVESDPDADRPYVGPDIVAVSGENGVATARVFPGFFQQQQGGGGGGGQQQQGPRNPLELPPPMFFGDAAVTVIYNGTVATLIGGGLTIGSGRLYDLGTVFLSDLGITAD